MSVSLRKMTLTTAAVMATFSLVSCGNGDNGDFAEGEEWQEELVTPGVLTIGTSGNYAPYTMMDGDEVVGYSIDQATALAERLDLEPHFETLEWSGILAGLAGGQYDVTFSGELLHTAERLEDDLGWWLADPTMEDGTGLIKLADNDEAVDHIDDIPEGATIAGVQGGAQPQIIDNHFGDHIEMDLYPGLVEAMEGLRAGRADYATGGRLVLAYFAQENDDLEVLEGAIEILPGSFGVAEQEALFDVLNEESQAMVEDGIIEELQLEWFGETSMPGESAE
ncbi:substrate-binding periplasmic protein [Nesterenkonia ebinurensis]|uniref:substrate-binding periplasmic protein n=1 Tax=Nesterenkonia ebinurensis TaxID=2608252 RepID=UPI00123CCCE0|nr:transporter substrate-binding domain-containing protein [Nesterenkonia ebinurensis]